MTSQCLHCGKPIRKGRSDKKFCDADCKDAFNNTLKQAEGKEINTIIGYLKKNRRALKKLFKASKPDATFTREEMIRAGFEFGFLTHVVVTKGKANEIIFCFDYGYRETSKHIYQVFPSYQKVKVKDGYDMKVK